MGKRGRASRSKRASSTGVTLVAQGKGKVKRTQQSPFDPAGSDNTEYFVREVKAERVKGFTTQWLIGWEGFSDREDTWEPIEHLAGYETEIRVFRERKKEEAAKAESDAAAEKQKKADEKEAVVVDVWKYFKVHKNEESGKVDWIRCVLCPVDNKPLPFCGNTTNLRVHLSSCHKDEYCKILATTANEGSSSEESSQAKLDSLVPQISATKRDELHKLITLWLVRNGRPLTLPERDQEFRDIFKCISNGQYVPPNYHTVMHNLLELSVEGKERLVASLKGLLSEGILPSIGGDIWSQGGISIFGILAYWLDEKFEYHEKLLAAIPVSSVRHTAIELEKATKIACADVGLGEYDDSVDGVPGGTA
ncbi:hypothetical protein CYMTET_20864 [Cymbomonas tetramitiformis]|uniref:Chromo domain-containing protein n=1 Tax=Cymbomonas tetramitiformis TaxID=36881 RepID=A0AAE0G4H8_9CHLO|nr:hypothetical protein CYMTET_20864 [Cymbomonas tetramitiformis]